MVVGPVLSDRLPFGDVALRAQRVVERRRRRRSGLLLDQILEVAKSLIRRRFQFVDFGRDRAQNLEQFDVLLRAREDAKVLELRHRRFFFFLRFGLFFDVGGSGRLRGRRRVHLASSVKSLIEAVVRIAVVLVALRVP